MAKYKMCPAIDNLIWQKAKYPVGFYGVAYEQRPENCKRIRIVCPVCKRRLMSSVEWEHDGDYIIHSLPTHKPKEWWKKGKPRKIRR
mgnify:CR=1 FL=1